MCIYFTECKASLPVSNSCGRWLISCWSWTLIPPTCGNLFLCSHSHTHAYMQIHSSNAATCQPTFYENNLVLVRKGCSEKSQIWWMLYSSSWFKKADTGRSVCLWQWWRTWGQGSFRQCGLTPGRCLTQSLHYCTGWSSVLIPAITTRTSAGTTSHTR